MNRFERHISQLDSEQLYAVWHALVMLQSDYSDNCAVTGALAKAIASAETKLGED